MCRCNQSAILQSIQSLAARPFGWDGRDALPVRKDAILLSRIVFGPGLFCLDGLSMPGVDLSPDGTIEVVFEKDEKELVLQFVSDRVVTFTQIFPDGETTIDGNLDLYGRREDCHRLVEILKWVGMKE